MREYSHHEWGDVNNPAQLSCSCYLSVYIIIAPAYTIAHIVDSQLALLMLDADFYCFYHALDRGGGSRVCAWSREEKGPAESV